MTGPGAAVDSRKPRLGRDPVLSETSIRFPPCSSVRSVSVGSTGTAVARGDNWIFHDVVEPDPETGEYPTPRAYIGAAGHCTDDLGERVSVIGGGEIGTVVYDSDLVGSGVDFSLVELDPDVVADTHPQMRGFVAPTGHADPADLAQGQLVGIHGYGLVLGQNDVTRDRQGVLVGWNDDEYVADMPAVNGDSGAPLVLPDSGLALGIISRYGFAATPPSTDTGPLLSWVLRELDTAGFTVELATIDG